MGEAASETPAEARNVRGRQATGKPPTAAEMAALDEDDDDDDEEEGSKKGVKFTEPEDDAMGEAASETPAGARNVRGRQATGKPPTAAEMAALDEEDDDDDEDEEKRTRFKSGGDDMVDAASAQPEGGGRQVRGRQATGKPPTA